MALLDYLTLTVPALAKKYRFAFMDLDPFFRELLKERKVRLQGGQNVRIRRVTGRHSDIVELNATNIAIPIVKVDTFSVMTGDWGRFGFPLVFPHWDKDRLPTAAEKKEWVDQVTRAGVSDKWLGLKTRVYTGGLRGSNPAYGIVGTLNGSAATAASAKSGFENGALRFETPAAQNTGAVSYLNLARTEDTTNDTNHWFNQYKAHNGIGVDMLETVEEIKAYADSFTEEGEEHNGIRIGILSIANWRKLSNEARTYPSAGGVAAVHYTVDDVKKGNLLPKVTVVGGVAYHPNRQMQTSAGADTPMNGPTEPCLLLNPSGCEYWINENLDMKVGKAVDFLDTSGQDADVAFCLNESQFAVPNLLVNGCTSKA